MRQVVGDHSVDEVLTIGREAIALQAKEELQRLCDLYGIGIEIQQLVLQDVNPPDPVKPAFNEVNQAIQEKERAINEAWADYNKAVPARQGRGRAGGARGRGLRARARQQRARATPSASRRSTRSTARRPRSRASASTSRRMAHVIPKLGRKLVLDEKARGILPLLAARRDGDGGEAVKRRPCRLAGRGGRAAPASPSVYTVSGDRAGDPHAVRPAGGRPGHRRPGLHFKVPFVQTVHRFDKRWLEFDGDANEIPTKDKKYIWVDTYARWRIADPLRFFQAVRDERGGAEPARRHRGRRDPQRGRLLRPDRGRALQQPRVPDHRGAGGHRLRGGHGARSTTGRSKIAADHPGEGRRGSRPSSASSWWTCASSASTTWTASSRRCSSA